MNGSSTLTVVLLLGDRMVHSLKLAILPPPVATSLLLQATLAPACRTHSHSAADDAAAAATSQGGGGGKKQQKKQQQKQREVCTEEGLQFASALLLARSLSRSDASTLSLATSPLAFKRHA